jgi:hypothetical protein
MYNGLIILQRRRVKAQLLMVNMLERFWRSFVKQIFSTPRYGGIVFFLFLCRDSYMGNRNVEGKSGVK